MEFRKRSRSNPLNDDDINELISFRKNARKNMCYNIVVWIFKIVTCKCCSYRKKRELKAAEDLKRAAYISQV